MGRETDERMSDSVGLVTRCRSCGMIHFLTQFRVSPDLRTDTSPAGGM